MTMLIDIANESASWWKFPVLEPENIQTRAYRKRPRPIVVNEDSVFLDNLEAAVSEYASWGFYHQGYGSMYKDRRMDWTVKPRERDYARLSGFQLSGFQTVPVNWSINDEHKRAFFQKIREIAGGNE